MSSSKGRRHLPVAGNARRRNGLNQRQSADITPGPALIPSSAAADVSGISSSFGSLSLSGDRHNRRGNQVPQIANATQRARHITQLDKQQVEDYVQRIVGNISPSQLEMDSRRDICINLQSNVRRVLPEAELKIMGGAGNTFALRNSDLDLCLVSTPGINVYELNLLVSEFKRAGHATELLLHTYIRLIKLSVDGYRFSQPVQVDISWNNTIGIHKTALLAAYSNTDRRVRPFVIFVKYWSKMRKVADTRQGGLGSFAWCLLCIYFLMKVAEPPVVPNLQAIAREMEYCQGYDVGFSKEVVMSNNWSPNRKTVGELVKGFFSFAHSFDFQNLVVSIRSTALAVTKSEKGWRDDLTRGYGSSGQRIRHSYYFAIEDPFEVGNNAGRTVTYLGQLRIKAELGRATSILDGLDGSDLFGLCAERLSL